MVTVTLSIEEYEALKKSEEILAGIKDKEAEVDKINKQLEDLTVEYDNLKEAFNKLSYRLVKISYISGFRREEVTIVTANELINELENLIKSKYEGRERRLVARLDAIRNFLEADNRKAYKQLGRLFPSGITEC